jgi:hypothetical protein
LSQVFAAIKQRRAACSTAEAHLAEITLQDARTACRCCRSRLPTSPASMASSSGACWPACVS